MDNKVRPIKICPGEAPDSLPASVKKYLTKYRSGNRPLETDDIASINNVIVIPAICEYENIKSLLLSLASSDNKYFPESLFLFVINNSVSSNGDIKENNADSLSLLRSIIKKNSTERGFTGKIEGSGLRIAVIDASSEGNELPESTAGAGLARKIGMDSALTVFDYGNKAKKIIVCLDADCTVEKNYLTELTDQFNKRNLNAAVIRYEHAAAGNPGTEEAIVCYEIYLYYYELGLKYAGSPFSFHAIGSTIACDHQSYIKVEGMNKRKAGEDFYFLEKLVKNVKVEKINTTTVHPASRRSWRVPFGTGPRISRFLEGVRDEYLLYNPVTFYILKSWLEIFLNADNLPTEEYLEKSEKINGQLKAFLNGQNFSAWWKNISANSAGGEQVYKQKIRWFDGFRTLKFVHFLRDNGYPLINMFDALDEIFTELGINLPGRKGAAVPGIEMQKKYLEIIKKNIDI